MKTKIEGEKSLSIFWYALRNVPVLQETFRLYSSNIQPWLSRD